MSCVPLSSECLRGARRVLHRSASLACRRRRRATARSRPVRLSTNIRLARQTVRPLPTIDDSADHVAQDRPFLLSARHHKVLCYAQSTTAPWCAARRRILPVVAAYEADRSLRKHIARPSGDTVPRTRARCPAHICVLVGYRSFSPLLSFSHTWRSARESVGNPWYVLQVLLSSVIDGDHAGQLAVRTLL